MKKAKYLIVDSGDVIKNNYSYPTPSIISVSLSPLNEIFDDNNIPREFQKLIVQVDSLFYGNPLLFKEWKEYITEVPFNFIEARKENGNKVIELSSSCRDYRVEVLTDLDYKKEKDVFEFMNSLREAGLLDKYVKSLIQIFNLPMVFEYETLYYDNGLKVKSLRQ